MDEGIYIKQKDISDWQSQKQCDEESLEHIVNFIIQYQQPSDLNEELKTLTGKRCLNDMSLQEDKRILELVQQVGPNFNKIVKHFPGKTMNMIKNRYYKKLRYKKEDLQSEKEDGKKLYKQRKQ